MLLLGVDQAARIARHGLAASRRCLSGGRGAAPPLPRHSSGRYDSGAALVPLPASAGWLSDALADVSGTGRGTGSLVCVVGGSGGVGASTLAAGLAFVAARASQRTMLIDADPRSGGLDLLMGAERTAGWRWPRLATARGHLGDLTGQLPAVEGVDLLSMARGESTPGWELQAEQLKSVLLSAMRSHDITVVDLPRTLGAPDGRRCGEPSWQCFWCGTTSAGSPPVVKWSRELAGECDRLGLVVRQGRSRLLEPKSGGHAASVCRCLDRSSMTRHWSGPPSEATRRRGLRRSSLARLCRRAAWRSAAVRTGPSRRRWSRT